MALIKFESLCTVLRHTGHLSYEVVNPFGLDKWRRIKGFSLYQQIVESIAQAHFCTACPHRASAETVLKFHERFNAGPDEICTLPLFVREISRLGSRVTKIHNAVERMGPEPKVELPVNSTWTEATHGSDLKTCL